MNLFELFDDDDEKKVSNSKVQHEIEIARSKYGWANNDLEAFIAMMQDEQEIQDNQIDAEYAVNTQQEKEINYNDSDIEKLEKRISKLEGGTQESIKESKLAKRIQRSYITLNNQLRATIYEDNACSIRKQLRNLIHLAEQRNIILEDDIEWEPQPDFRKAKTTNQQSTGPSANRKPTNSSANGVEKELNEIWRKMLLSYKRQPPTQRDKMKPKFIKVMQVAKKRKIKLNPDPARLDFLQTDAIHFG